MKNHYGIFVTSLGLLIALAANAQATPSFTGIASTQGDSDLHCQDIPEPSPQDAEADAYRQAEAFCDLGHGMAVQVGGFSYQQTACHIEGHGFATHSVQSVSATAEYQCIRKIFFETGFRQCEADCAKETVNVESDAVEKARAECVQTEAERVSDWNVRMIGYGRLYATAAFSCAE